MADLPSYTIDLGARTAASANNENQYLGFQPTGRYRPYIYKGPGKNSYGDATQGPYQAYGLGNDPYELLARQYHNAGLLGPEQNPYSSQAAVRAMSMASGATGDKLGAATRGAIDEQAAAAYGIQRAGRTNAMAQNQQFGQTRDDLNVVRASALGTGPSAAENLARSQLDSNIRAQASLASSARGGNIASAMRGAQGAGSSMMLQSQAQMAAQRAQEQLNAQSNLTQGNYGLNQSLGTARTTDVNQAISVGNALDRTAANQQGLSGFQGNLMFQGQNNLGVSADRYDSEMARMLQAQMQGAGAITGYGLQKYGLDLGLPAQTAGAQANLSIANMEDKRLRDAAVINAAASGAAASAQLIK